MDAKPQRPVRIGPSQAPGIESVAPIRQTLHHRHKSAGNMKAMATNASTAHPTGLKGATKRAAFGEVNVNARLPTDLNSKKVQVISIDSGKENGLKGAAAFQTSQRPTNTGMGPSVSYTADFHPAKAAPSLVETYNSMPHRTVGDSLAQGPVKPSVSKKATFIYQDDAHRHQQGQGRIHDSLPFDSSADAISVENKSGLPTKQPRHHKSQPYIKAEQPALRRTVSRQLSEVRSLMSTVDDNDVPELPYEDALEELVDANDAIHGGGALINFAGESAESNVGLLRTMETYALERPLPPPPAAAYEPEEYWDDDEGELDDEQGYTTAHSFRSHGENTTGGLTLILAPKVTTRVQQELELARVVVEEARTEDEIEEESWDVSMVAEYGEEIFAYMRELEARMMPDPHYMDIQTEIQWSMRSVLVDWVIQVHHRFQLLPETLFLSINYVDRFLSQKVVSVAKLQLVGATALFIAAKYEEINCPSVNEIIFMVDNGFKADEILKAERFMLSMLKFELGWPGPMSFLRRISKADDYDLETRTLAKYFLEVTVVDERFVGSPPSFLAAGAHCLSRLMLRKGDWSQAHTYWSGYTWTQLKPLVTLLLDCCQFPNKHHATVFEKYSDRRYKRASSYVQEQIALGFYLPYQAQHLLIAPSSLTQDPLPLLPYSSHEVNRLVSVAQS